MAGKENGAKTGTEVEMEAKETGNRCKKCGGEAGATHVCGRNTRERVEAVGFSNDLGDSNCFLNSALQSLNFEVDCPKTEDHFCVVCGLKAVNEEYGMLQHCGGGTIDITRYRIALAELFVSKDKFQLEKTADAMEALSAILQSLHAKASGDETLGLDENFTNRYCNAACPSHQAFSLELLEQLECKCRATSEPLPWDFSSFQFQVYVSDLIDEVSPLLALSTKPRSCISSIKGRLGETIKRVNVTYMQRKRTVQECPDNCRFKKSIKTMQLMSAAEGFILNLVWSEKNPKATEILSVIALLPTQMFLSSLFSQEAAAATGDTYTLKGFIAYGFVHYIAYFKTEDGWRKYDDAMVRTVSSYGKVMLNLVESRFHPVGVFYEKSKPDSLLVPDAVTDPEWDILELKASSITSEEIKDDEDWSCPLCSKTNLSGRMVCDTCFGLRPGLVGWACITCSSVNDDESDTCGTCGHYRKYVCRRCMKPGFSRTCRSCELLYEKTDSGKVCSKCKVKPAILEGVCSSCYDDISASKTLTMKSKKQSDILSQSLEMTTCPVCKSKMASDSGCPNCKKELVETRLSQSVIPGKEACTQCGKLKVNCMCVSSPVPAARAVVSFCTTCNRRRENCGCPQTKAVRECEVCHINELYCSCRNPPSHSTKLRTANAVCLKCNHRRENCVCPQTKAVRECERCHLSEANCTCRGSVSHSVKSEVDICARCRNPKRTCTCKGVSTVSKTPATKGEKVCIECRGFLTASKYCAKCFNSHSIVEAKCHRCLSQFRGWVCKKCKDKLQAASASRR